MHDTVLNSGLDTFLFAVPFLFMLLGGIFHLDELVAAPKPATKRRQMPVGTDERGEPLLCDPDGRPFGFSRNDK